MAKQQAELELWGGLECTVNRVHDTWMDQMERCGHRNRLSDFDQIAALGLRTLRYGLHWETFVAAGTLDIFAEPLARMQRLGIEPIAGLIHHGSGPATTNLLDPEFPEKLADYARSVAQRFPGLRRYTPVNEPQTTARFSALYGHWHPHHRSFRSYARALVNQLKATVLSMRAIREVRPDAKFVSTEDGGKIWATEPLRALGEERESRRWLGLDLLCGRVDHRHPMFVFLRHHGIEEREILWFAENPCPPDVIGLNYYLTSDRVLDDKTWHYPAELRGGDTGNEPAVDIEALRVRSKGIAGAGLILTEAWQRYEIPVAITECHLGGSEDDQVRWLAGVWNEAQLARDEGVDVVAITVWSLLGSFDWSSLVTLDRGDYEPGVFDVRSGQPRPTALAAAVRQLAHGQPLATGEPGWWQRPDRLTFPAFIEQELQGKHDPHTSR